MSLSCLIQILVVLSLVGLPSTIDNMHRTDEVDKAQIRRRDVVPSTNLLLLRPRANLLRGKFEVEVLLGTVRTATEEQAVHWTVGAGALISAASVIHGA